MIMKKMVTLFILIAFLIPVIALADVGCAVDRFSKDYILTSKGAHDIAAVAEAQIGICNKTFQYRDAWCAAFVVDCAKLAGQESAIPFISGKSHAAEGLRQAVIEHGGKVVSKPRKGDLIFYFHTGSKKAWHVGIMTSDSTLVDGNGLGCTKAGHTDTICAQRSIYINHYHIVDRNFKTVKGNEAGIYTIMFVRPKYLNKHYETR